MSSYKDTARELGIRLRFWKWGITFLNRDPAGNVYKLVQVVPLWGWSFDQQELKEAVDELNEVARRKKK